MSLVKSWCDSDGRFLLCEFSLCDKIFRVCCLYAPNRNPARNDFFDEDHPEIDPSVPTVLVGDFNAVFDRALDCAGSSPEDTLRESTVALKRLFNQCCVCDIWRYLHPSSSGFTWSRWNGQFSSRIDLVGCPFSWVPSVSSCDIVPRPFSDQCAVFCVSIPDTILSGPGLWKLNTSVLEEEDYIRLISGFWHGWRHRQSSFPSLAKWWERGKSEIK